MNCCIFFLRVESPFSLGVLFIISLVILGVY